MMAGMKMLSITFLRMPLRYKTFHIAGYVALGLLASIGLYNLLAVSVSIAKSASRWRDLNQDWLLAKALVAHLDPNTSLTALASQLGYDFGSGWPNCPTPHPPTLGLLLLPMNWLSYAMASQIWLFVSVALLGATVLVLGKMSNISIRPFVGPAVTLALILWNSVYADLQWGQVNILLTFVFAIMVLAVQRGQSYIAGIFLGITFLIKPFAWPIVLFLAFRRQWHILIPAITTTAIGYAITTVIIGPSAMIRYFLSTGPAVHAVWHNHSWNISLASVGTRLFDGVLKPNPSGGSPLPIAPIAYWPEVAHILEIIIPLFVLIIGLWTVRNLPVAQAIGVLLCVSILISPIAWDHYLVLCLIPLALSYQRLTRGFIAISVLLALNYNALVDLFPAATAYIPLMFSLVVIEIALYAFISAIGNESAQPQITT